MAGLCPPAARDAVRVWGRKPAARRPLGGVASPAVLHPWRRFGRAVLPPVRAPSHGAVGRDSVALCEDAGQSAVDDAPARSGEQYQGHRSLRSAGRDTAVGAEYLARCVAHGGPAVDCGRLLLSCHAEGGLGSPSRPPGDCRLTKRLKLTGAYRSKGIGVLYPWRARTVRPTALRRRASRPQLKRDPLAARIIVPLASRVSVRSQPATLRVGGGFEGE